MAVDKVSKAVRFDAPLADEVARYAAVKGIGFSAAVRELCRQALHLELDKNYAPGISRVVERSSRVLGDRIERSMDIYAEQIVDRVGESIAYWMDERTREAYDALSDDGE